ncbi:MAG: choice-of-anchor Q domain-containing protein [Patescibacteria group bacterium]|jgi:hypothetical protein|nr:choice-of-anchor Q domain-containing protein [Patescibacteria group bacterium]
MKSAKISLISSGLIFFASVFLFATSVQAATIYINSSAGNDSSGDGSFGSPYKTFHKGYTSASSGDTLDLTGTFTWTDADEAGDVQTTGYTISKNLTIQGQAADTTIIQAATAYATGNSSVFTISAGVTATMNDVTIRYAYNRTGSNGGGINNEGTLTVNRCSISYNYVWYYPSWGGYGGGIRNAGTLYVNDSTIDNNFAESQGGGIVNAYTAANSNVSYITNTTIAFNSTKANVATVGGAGFYNRSGISYITNTTIAYNNATDQSWPYNTGNTTGLDISAGAVYLKNSIVAYNKVNGSYLMNDGSGYDIGTDSASYLNDNGGNIFGTTLGMTTYNSTTWVDKKSGGSGDGVFVLEGTAATGSLYLDTSLAANGTMVGTQTLSVTNESSIAVDNGVSGSNGPVSVPSQDQRGATRIGAALDIGAYEYGWASSEPATQTSELVFSDLKYNQLTLSWTNGDGWKRAVFAKQASTGTASTTNAVTYTADTTFGSGTEIDSTGWYCVYNGNGTGVTVSGFFPETDYIFQSFEYNGGAGSELYLADIAADNPNTTTTLIFTAPTVQAHTLSFSSISNSRLSVSWSNGNGEARAVFIKQAATGTAIPVDATTYSANAALGSGDQIGESGWYAVYNGTGTSVTITGLLPETDYIIQVFEYNGSAGTELYLSNTASSNPNSQATNASPTGDDFETGDFTVLDWTFGGNLPWTVTSGDKNGGTYSARSGAITHSQSSYMEVTVDVPVNGNLTFYKKVSSEGSYDYLRFYLDSTLKNSWSGTVAWSQQSYPIASGSRTFRWTYSKDGSVNSGSDTSWIDDIVFPQVLGTTYTLSYVAGANGSLSGYTSQIVNSGEDGYAVTAAANTGYHFVNWSDESTANPRTDTNVTENISVTANFAINTYTLAYAAGSHGSISGSTSQTVNYGSSGSAVTAVPDSNYHFVNWSDGSTANPRTDTNVTANKSVTANFAIDTRTLSYTAGAHGSISGSTSQTVNYGSSGTAVTAVPLTGYHFVNWSDESTANPRTDTNVTENISVTASFDINSYTLAYTAGDNGALTGDTSQTVEYGSSGTAVTAVPDTDFIFVNWSDGLTSNPRTDSNVSDNISVVANFATSSYSLSYVAGVHGSISGLSSQTVSYDGDGMAVTAVPDTGYHFVSWSDESINNPRTDTNVTADLSVTASFAINTYTLSYAAGDNGSLTGSTSQTVNYGSSGSGVTAVPDTDYVFVSWSDGSTANPRTDSNVTANVSVSANFADNLIYVNSSTGNDTTGNGTSGSPYKTFYKAYTSAESGDVIDLAGIFTWTSEDELGDTAINGYTIAKDLTIRGHGADETIIQATSYDNTADRRVLTISSGSTVAIRDLAIRYGKLTTSSADGGGIKNSGTLTITDCEIYNNRSAGAYGGGIANWNKLTLNRSTVYNNVANYMGGGLVNSYYVAADGYLNITNSTIVYNQVTAVTAYTEGGGVHYRKGSGTISNSTIAYNTACGASGVGMDDPDGVLTIKNTLIAKNIRLNHSYCHNGLAPVDFDFRQAGYGNVVDNGNNIIGYSYRYAWSGDNNWIGANTWSGALSWDRETFTLSGTDTTGSLNLESSLALNGNASSTKTLALLADSIAINNGATGINGDVTIPDADQRGIARSDVPDIGAFEYDSPPVDNTAPFISDVSVTVATTTAVITWSTDEEASSQVKYDPGTCLSTHTPVYDSTVKTIGHEVTISNLIACSKYYYAVISQDDAGNVAIGDTESFITTGCAGGANIETISELTYIPATTNGAEVDGTSSATDDDYTLTQTAGGLTFGLVIPRTFSESPANLQVKSLSATTALESLFAPSGYDKAGTAVFDLKALPDPASTIGSFDSSVTVSFSYSDSDLSGLDETSLVIYRHDGTSWSALSNCSVNVLANSITCSTNNFSTFGLFGQAASSSDSGGLTSESAPIASSGPIAPPPAKGGGSKTESVSLAQTVSIGRLSNQGVNVLSYVNSQVNFQALVSASKLPENHSFKISSLDLLINKITLIFYSKPQTFDLVLGQTIVVDLDQDNMVDIEATFTDLVVNRIEITIKSILRDQANGQTISTPALNYRFLRDLKLGMIGSDVKQLQQYLNQNGFIIATGGAGSPGNETEYFGSMTKQALAKFQQANGIPAFGCFGEITRNLINRQGFAGISGIEEISIDDIRPGMLVKNKKFAEVFYVNDNSQLQWIINEQAANKHFGTTWNQIIKEIEDLGLANLKFGSNLD